MSPKSIVVALAATMLILPVTRPSHTGFSSAERVVAHPVLASVPVGLRLAQADTSPSMNQRRASQQRQKKPPKPGQRSGQESSSVPISARVAKSRQAQQKIITTVSQAGEIEHRVRQHKVLRNRIKVLKAKAKKQKLSAEESAQLTEAENKVSTFESDMNKLVDGLEQAWNDVISQYGVDPDHPLLRQAILTEDNGFMSDQGQSPTCGHHSCRMVLQTQGKLVSAEQLIQQAPLRKDGNGVEVGITIDDIKGLFTKNRVDAAVANYKMLGSHNAVKALKQTIAIAQGPLIVRVKPNQQFRDLIEAGSDPSMPASVQRAAKIAKRRAEYSHFVVIEGVVSVQTEHGWQEHFVIRDPQNMTYTHPVSGFEQSFTGEVVFPTKALPATAEGANATQ